MKNAQLGGSSVVGISAFGLEKLSDLLYRPLATVDLVWQNSCSAMWTIAAVILLFTLVLHWVQGRKRAFKVVQTLFHCTVLTNSHISGEH